jgi:hypothetical protein
MGRAGLLHSAGLAAVVFCALLIAGCGTTKWSDSPRTATEQLLVSDAIDRAITQIDFEVLADKNVYLDTRFIITALDQNYVISTLRQHMLASGCVIKDKPEEATYVVEVRTGSLGTNRQDLLFGVPATTLPTAGLLPVGAAAIPEIAILKRTNQQGVCKIAVFAYDRMTGRPVWQSGNRKVASRAKDVWVAGAGPFQRGTIYDGTAFAGEQFAVPLVKGKKSKQAKQPAEEPERLSVTNEKVFGNGPQGPPGNGVQNAGYVTPLPGTNQPAATMAMAPPPPGSAPANNPPPQASPAPAEAKPADGKPAEPPKAAYTPPLPPPVPLPPPAPPAVTPGPQGNLAPQSVLPATANPAATTAGAIQMYNWAREFSDRSKPESTTPTQ